MIKKTMKLLNAIQYFEKLGLISGSDWKSIEIMDSGYRKRLVEKIIDNAAKANKHRN